MLKLLMLLTLLFCFGCNDQSSSSISPEDLALAQGVKCWSVRLPADLQKDHLITVTYKSSDGRVQKDGAYFKGFQAGQVVKVFLFQPEGDSEELAVSIVDGKNAFRFSIPNRFQKTEMRAVFFDKDLVEVGQVFCKGNTQKLYPELVGSEFGLIVHREKTAVKK